MDFVIWCRTNWDRLLGWALVALGGVFLVVGTMRVSHARLLANSLSYLMSAGLGGLGCVAFGSALLISAASHDEWQKLDRIERCLREVQAGVTPGYRPVTVDLTASKGSSRPTTSQPTAPERAVAGVRREGA